MKRYEIIVYAIAMDAYNALLAPSRAGVEKSLGVLQEIGKIRSKKASHGSAERMKYSFINISETGIRMAYKEWGAASGKDVIILLHGAGTSSSVWDGVASEMANAGYRVFALDARGHGRSTHSTIYTCESMLRDLHGFIIEKDLYVAPVCIFGLGMGAVVALTLAHRCPKLVGAVGALEMGVLIDDVDDSKQPWICRSLGQEKTVYGHEYELASWLRSPLSSIGPRLAQYCRDKTANELKDDPEFTIWMERATGDEVYCHHVAKELLREDSMKGVYVSRMDRLFEFQFDIETFKAVLENITVHVLFAFGEYSSVVSRQDVCRVTGMCQKAESLTVEEMAGQSSNFIRDSPEESSDMLLDFLLDTALHCFDVPKNDAWSRTPANLGLRPLPEYESLEEAKKALGPRRIPNQNDIEQALRSIRIEEGRDPDDVSDDEDWGGISSSGARTALSADPMDYFGFVG